MIHVDNFFTPCQGKIPDRFKVGRKTENKNFSTKHKLCMAEEDFT